MKPPPLVYRPPRAPWLSIAHVDDDAIVIDKPGGLLSVPGRGPELSDCVEARARAIFPEALIVHRLDMDTAGLILMARNRRAQRILSGQFEKRIVRKVYEAEVSGAPAEPAGVIDLPLRADWPNRPRQMVCHAQGRRAVTRWEVAERRGETTLMRLFPETGRSHQLRVHMAELGCPIVGDPIYGAGDPGPMRLFATEIAWRRPADGTWARVTRYRGP